MSHPAMHPAVEPLAPRSVAGEGKGEYPTVEHFAYGEEIEFSHTGRPFFFICRTPGTRLMATRCIRNRGTYDRSQKAGSNWSCRNPAASPRFWPERSPVPVSRWPVQRLVSARRPSRYLRSNGSLPSQPTPSANQLDMAAVGQEMNVHWQASLEKVLSS